jgi:hypothetical protein
VRRLGGWHTVRCTAVRVSARRDAWTPTLHLLHRSGTWRRQILINLGRQMLRATTMARLIGLLQRSRMCDLPQRPSEICTIHSRTSANRQTPPSRLLELDLVQTMTCPLQPFLGYRILMLHYRSACSPCRGHDFASHDTAHPSCGMEGQRQGWRDHLSPPSTRGGAICHNDQGRHAEYTVLRPTTANRQTSYAQSQYLRAQRRSTPNLTTYDRKPQAQPAGMRDAHSSCCTALSSCCYF